MHNNIFYPQIADNLAVTTVTARKQMLSVGNGKKSFRLCNNGNVPINIRVGDVTVNAVTTDMVMVPNSVEVFEWDATVYIAAIAAVGTSSLNITVGNGK